MSIVNQSLVFSRVLTSCKFPLIFEMPSDLGRGLLPNKRFQIVNARQCDTLNRAEFAEQFHLPLIANARYFGELG